MCVVDSELLCAVCECVVDAELGATRRRRQPWPWRRCGGAAPHDLTASTAARGARAALSDHAHHIYSR